MSSRERSEEVSSKYILEAVVLGRIWKEGEERIQQEQLIVRMRITRAEVGGGRKTDQEIKFKFLKGHDQTGPYTHCSVSQKKTLRCGTH